MQIYQSFLTPDLKKQINDGFKRHALQKTEIDGLNEEPIVFEIRKPDSNSSQTIIGCTAVQIFLGELHIKNLFVDESFRSQGIGTRLMKHALEFAQGRGCQFSFVETMSFQAVTFYEKLGFKIDFCRSGYSNDTSFYYLSKDLRALLPLSI